MNSDEILRKLSFRIKKPNKLKKPERTVSKSENSLRLRMVPEDLKERLRTAPIESPSLEKETNEQETSPVILAHSNLVDIHTARSRKNKRKNGAAKSNEAQRLEAIAHLRRLNRIYRWGENVPEPVLDWLDLSLPAELLSNMNTFGIGEPTPIQMQAIPIMMQRRNLLACAPTGSGKTLAFTIPLICDVLRLKKVAKYSQGGTLFSVVLEPTHDLARQTYRQLVKFSHGLNISCGLLGDENSSENPEILVSTPNRLIFSLSSMELKYLRWLVVDESDRLFDNSEGMEKSFRSQLATIYRAVSSCKWLHKAFFSATFSYEMEKWCEENLEDVAMLCIGERNSASASVEQKLVFTGSEAGKVVALRELLNTAFTPPALLFVQSKERAQQVMNIISTQLSSQVPASLICSQRSPAERASVLSALRDGRLWLLVCTDLVGRGLDLATVNLVVNFDLPTSIISYIHRIGRAGRAGRRGQALTFFTESDLSIVRPIAVVIQQAGFPVPEYTLALKPPSKKEKKKLLTRAPKRKNIVVVGGKKKSRKEGGKSLRV